MKKMIRSLKNKDAAVAAKIGLLKNKKEGMSEFMAVLLVILCAVIIGAALLAVMKVAMPELFNSIIDKIKTTFEL